MDLAGGNGGAAAGALTLIREPLLQLRVGQASLLRQPFLQGGGRRLRGVRMINVLEHPLPQAASDLLVEAAEARLAIGGLSLASAQAAAVAERLLRRREGRSRASSICCSRHSGSEDDQSCEPAHPGDSSRGEGGVLGDRFFLATAAEYLNSAAGPPRCRRCGVPLTSSLA
eukprot:scaffold48_cov311-Pinguiococcus_pyrenoidosus.AAC.26